MPRSYSMATRAAATAAAQEHLVASAVEELLEVGGDGFTMQGVAKRADVALRTLYNYFPTRDELLAATFDHLAARTRTLIVDVEADHGTHAEQLRVFVGRLYELFEDEGEPLTTLLALRGVAALDDAVSEIRSWRRERLAAMLQGIDAETGLAVPLDEAVALAFVLTAHATWHSLAIQSGLGSATAQRLTTDVLLAAVCGPAADRSATTSTRRARAAKR
jgi:AcrR family transcriptional regulator